MIINSSFIKPTKYFLITKSICTRLVYKPRYKPSSDCIRNLVFQTTLKKNQRKMALNFCANLGFLFKDNDMGLLDRYAAAGKAGFRAVEAPFPEGIPLETVRDALISAGITQILINIMIGEYCGTIDMIFKINCEKLLFL